jgi:hypothetical protein
LFGYVIRAPKKNSLYYEEVMKGVVDGEAEEEAPAPSSLLGQLSSQRVSKARCSLSHCFSACHISSSLSCESRLSHHAVIIIFIIIATAAATASIAKTNVAKTNVAKTMVAIFGATRGGQWPNHSVHVQGPAGLRSWHQEDDQS